MPTTSSYLLECLASRPEGPGGLSADPADRWWVDWVVAMAGGQHLVIRSYENNIGRIFAPKNSLRQLLDDFWCRYVLHEIPLIVERIQKLEELRTDRNPSETVRHYFEQAMRCFAIGLPEASVALMRACLEHALRDAVAHADGIQDLEALIRWAGHSRKLDAAHMQMANRVRILGNDVMHKGNCTSDNAFEAVTMLRAIIGALYGIDDDSFDPSEFSRPS